MVPHGSPQVSDEYAVTVYLSVRVWVAIANCALYGVGWDVKGCGERKYQEKHILNPHHHQGSAMVRLRLAEWGDRGYQLLAEPD